MNVAGKLNIFRITIHTSAGFYKPYSSVKTITVAYSAWTTRARTADGPFGVVEGFMGLDIGVRSCLLTPFVVSRIGTTKMSD